VKLWKKAAEAYPPSHDEVLGRGDLDAQPARRMTDVEDKRATAQDPIELEADEQPDRPRIHADDTTSGVALPVPARRPIELALLGLARRIGVDLDRHVAVTAACRRPRRGPRPADVRGVM
jgi:hypothetical protein